MIRRLPAVLVCAAAVLSCRPAPRVTRERRPDPGGERQIVEVDLAGSFDETPQGLFSGDQTLRAQLELLQEIRRDPDVIGVLTFIGPLDAGLTKVEDLANALAAVRSSGRKVYCGLESATNRELFLAARSCDHVAMAPGGSLELTGIAADVLFFRSALASLGIQAEVEREGAYKDAFDPAIRDSMSPEMRESLDALLDDTFGVLVDGIARGRNLPPSTVRALVDRGLFSPDEAKSARLVDSVRYPDALRYVARKEMSGKVRRDYGRERRDADSGDLTKLVRSLAGEPRPPSPEEPHLAVVYVTGLIASGGEGGLMGPDVASARTLVRALERVRRDRAIRALVLRIDSPGGSAAASDLIWRAVERVRQKKPVVASMSDVAASGGYYVAAPATKIMAQRSTVTGSIGVITAKIVARELADKLGVTVQTLQRGALANLGSPFRPWSPDEHSAIARMTASTYQLFLRRVAEGRHQEQAAVHRVAQGRVWSGARARALGLVDEIGGFEDALGLARRLGHLAATAPIEVFPEPSSVLEQLLGNAGTSTRAGPGVGAALEVLPVPAPVRRAAQALQLLERERSLAALPFSLHFR